MLVRFVGFVIALVLAGPAQAEAQERSLAKILAGLGIAAGGVVLAFSKQDCRVAGTLSGEPAAARTFSNIAGDVYQVFHNARDASATKTAGGDCALDWQVDRTGVGITWLLNDPIVGPRETKLASAFRGDYSHVDETRGTARAEKYRPKGLLYGGLAMAGAGALLAILWADAPDVSMDLQHRRLRVSKTIGF